MGGPTKILKINKWGGDGYLELEISIGSVLF